jgi:hypothetical protein
VIRRDQSDLPALGQQSGILDCHLRGYGRTRPADIGIKAGLVAEASDLDHLVHCLRRRAAGKHQARGHYRGCNQSLHFPSNAWQAVR